MPMRLLKNDTNYLALVTATFLSSVGDTLRVLAITFWVLEGSGYSPLARAVVLLAGVLPPLLLGPVAGIFVDRWDRRAIMVTADLLRAGLSLGLLVSFVAQSLPLTLVCVALSGVVAQFFDPSRFALLPKLVQNPRDLTRANSIIETGLRAVGIFTPPLAALIYFQLGGAWAFAIDALSFLASALVTSLIRVEPPPALERGAPFRLGQFLADARDGLGYLRGHAAARFFILTTTGLTVTSNINQVGLIFLITLALQLPAADLAWVFSVNGIAQVVAAVVVGIFARRIKPAPLLVGALAVMALTQFGMGLAPNLAWLALWVFVGAIANAPYSIAFDTVLQQTIDEAYLGRVYGLWDAVDAALRVLVIGVAGYAIALFGPRGAIVGAGVVGLFCVAIGYLKLLPALRQHPPAPISSVTAGTVDRRGG